MRPGQGGAAWLREQLDRVVCPERDETSAQQNGRRGPHPAEGRPREARQPDRGQGSPWITSPTGVCMAPLSRFRTTALAIRVRWPMFPRLMPPAALEVKGSMKAAARPGPCPPPLSPSSWPRLRWEVLLPPRADQRTGSKPALPVDQQGLLSPCSPAAGPAAPLPCTQTPAVPCPGPPSTAQGPLPREMPSPAAGDVAGSKETRTTQGLSACCGPGSAGRSPH